MLRLTEERLKLGISKMELGFLTRIHPADIGKLESGKIYPYPGFKKKLSEALGVDGDKLFEEVDENGR